MPKNDTGGEPNEEQKDDVKLCGKRYSPHVSDIFKYDCVAAAIGMYTSD